MNTVVLLGILAVVLVIGWKVVCANLFWLARKRYAITLKNGEGEFVGVLVQRRWAGMTFDDISIPPQKASEAPELVPGRLHVERVNVAYLQELPNDTG